jgi:hypothetical protein
MYIRLLASYLSYTTQSYISSHLHHTCVLLNTRCTTHTPTYIIKSFSLCIMGTLIPKSFFSTKRSSFSLIDPSTAQFNRQVDRHGYFTSGLRTHVAISYVWSEWRKNPDDRLPDWQALQARLKPLLGASASQAIRSETGRATRCWLDCMCINQNSPEDKAYWIPRMDEIYYEARCTILLLNIANTSLRPLLELKQRLHCSVSGPLRFKDIALMVPHSCLLCQSCTSSRSLDSDLELAVLDALRRLSNATWRSRAWILQEILLSQNYLLTWDDSGEWLSLPSVGTMAAVVFRQNLQETWLDDFASWCRRLWYLRQNYDESQTYELCDANVLQLASGLAATVPSDKYYALCGILRLKHVKPDSSHTADQALEAILNALVNEGRMSWLYAVLPTPDGVLQLRDGRMTPFIMTRLEARLSPNKRHNATIKGNTLSLEAVHRGQISSVLPFSQVLERAFSHLRETRNFDFPEPISYCHHVPDIIRRLALDIVDPLLSEPTFSHLCKTLKVLGTVKAEARKRWLCIMFLSFIDEPLIQEMCEGCDENDITAVRSAAKSLQRHLRKIGAMFELIRWTVNSEQHSSTRIAVALAGCPLDASAFSLNGDPASMFVARLAASDSSPAEFFGSLFLLNVRDTIGPRPSTIFSASFWRSKGTLVPAQLLHFKYI